MPWLDIGDREEAGELNGCLEGACALAEEETALWKPLVLLIPLRLGLSDINEAYIDTLKVTDYTVNEAFVSRMTACQRSSLMTLVFVKWSYHEKQTF